MKAVRPMTHEQRAKIQMYIKNKMDISALLDGYQLRNEDLSYSIISRFNRVSENISNTNFSNSVIGEDNFICNLSGCNFMGSNFSRVKFLGIIWLRRCNLTNSNFYGAWMPGVELNGSDITNMKMCDAFIRLGVKNWFGVVGRPYRAETLEGLTELQSQYLT